MSPAGLKVAAQQRPAPPRGQLASEGQRAPSLDRHSEGIRLLPGRPHCPALSLYRAPGAKTLAHLAGAG